MPAMKMSMLSCKSLLCVCVCFFTHAHGEDCPNTFIDGALCSSKSGDPSCKDSYVTVGGRSFKCGEVAGNCLTTGPQCEVPSEPAILSSVAPNLLVKFDLEGNVDNSGAKAAISATLKDGGSYVAGKKRTRFTPRWHVLRRTIPSPQQRELPQTGLYCLSLD